MELEKDLEDREMVTMFVQVVWNKQTKQVKLREKSKAYMLQEAQ